MSNNADSLGDRMKNYENVYNHKLIRRLPVIIRLDGRAFHTLTKNMCKPFDERFNKCMLYTTVELVKEIQGAVFGYTQSDEISILVKDWDTHTTEAWFDDKIQKMVSVSASIATRDFIDLARFQFLEQTYTEGSLPQFEQIKYRVTRATFDSRVFNLPFEEVNNYFLWRQNDATRNSVNALAQSRYPHKELQGLNVTEVKAKLIKEKNIDWETLPQWQKMGQGVKRVKFPPMLFDPEHPEAWTTKVSSVTLPIFSQNPDFINDLLLEEKDLNAS